MSRKTDRATWETNRVFFGENCVLLQGLDMSGLEVRGQKIPNPAKKNSIVFQLGTDDTKGYAGTPILKKHEGCIYYMFQLQKFMHFINPGTCNAACVCCFVHMHES